MNYEIYDVNKNIFYLKQGLPDMARNSFSIIDSNAQKNRITTMFYVCILELIRNWLKTHFLGVLYTLNPDKT